ncbi:MAG: hypothetical protein COT17_01520 [Elusimicrobia bacterium CG08_land_8_20_14_0_20_51_18]|nr:MAG: hypothetical protein COT17_01520 [Elusimicrobia bacterium CG08_land_8_20_14_0_20_51_18]
MRSKPVKTLFFIPVCLALLVYAYAETKNGKETTNSLKKFKFYSISALKAKKPASGFFNTEGYVVKIYTCPPCPEGAMCKPCMRNNILISENANLQESYMLAKKDMILFTDKAKDFRLGEKYRFSIKVMDYSTTGDSINDVELIGWEQPAVKKKKTPEKTK